MALLLSGSDSNALAVAAKSLLSGGLVVFPTETVYGLGADASNVEAVSRIFNVKGRPTSHPLIVHVASVEYLENWANLISANAIRLADTFWPGPLTLILKRNSNASDAVTGGQDTVGIRIPGNEIALELLHKFHKLGGLGVAAPSANRFGKVSPTNVKGVLQEIESYLYPTDILLEGGDCEIGLESTIIDCTKSIPKILRPGAITSDIILKEIGISVDEHDSTKAKNSEIRVSGSLESHYSPRAKVILDKDPVAGSGLIALNDIETPEGVIRLASPKSVEDFAHTLYDSMRIGDELNLAKIFVFQPLGSGLSIAIRDRLSRASNSD
jgi:L-threonylcarbamoyladenylate synthase